MVVIWPEGVERLVFDELTSTNDRASELARQGQGPTWVLAHHQTGSRGRRGRAWAFKPGNFAASYLVWPQRPHPEFAQMSFVAALALLETTRSFLTTSELKLKWPNDLLIAGKKVSGILLESVDGPAGKGLIVGIGVNLVHAPPKAELEDRALPATAFSEHLATPPDAETFLAALAPEFARWQRIWEQSGFAPIREAWLASAVGLGQNVTARLPNAEHKGVFEDIDVDGSIVIRTPSGRLTLPAADIYFV